jgi:hypothetical protein
VTESHVEAPQPEEETEPELPNPDSLSLVEAASDPEEDDSSPDPTNAAIQVCRSVREADSAVDETVTKDGADSLVLVRSSRKVDDAGLCDAAICLFERSGIVPDYDKRDSVVRRIHRRGMDAVICRNYVEAERMHQLHSRFLLALAAADKTEAQTSRNSQIDAKISAARDELAVAIAAWDNRVEEVNESREKRLRELRAVHRQKLKQFEDEYDKVEKFRKYSKPSPALLELRWRERSMVMCNRFPEAKAIQQRALAIEQAESERAQGIAEMEVMRKRDWILVKQAQEIEGVMTHYENFMIQIQTQMQKSLHSLQHRIEVLELLRKAHSRGGKGFYSTLDPPDPYGLPTPRTRDNYHQFRLSHPGRKLPVTPLKNLAKKFPKSIEPNAALIALALRKGLHG